MNMNMKRGFLPLLIVATSLAAPTLAQGLFAGLSNRQDEIEKAKTEFMKVFASYWPSRFIEGEMARKDDGTPNIAIGGDGSVQVAVKLDVNRERYDEWVATATNCFAKYAEKVLAPMDRLEPDDYSKPKIRVDGTTFVFPDDMESAIKAANSDENRMPQRPCIAVFLVDIDGNVVAEPESKVSNGTTIEQDMKLYSDERTLKDDGSGLSVSDVSLRRFDGFNITDCGLAWTMNWNSFVEKETGNKSLSSRFENRHQLTTESFPDEGPLEKLGWHTDFGYKGAKTKTISFGKLSKETLEKVQGVRVCVGGIQYYRFLMERMRWAAKEADERKALEED